ncbi:hypothetical protein CS0771_55290 [Catellatospora sp. IY07-71]|uniref:hypothetical protein n=1 Tax=Catellatospora sp. IY07-71 TaxID=2728827 RepID=UPI001BB377D2|nr:hypothetical protein [Catellatospora sp. IY07-71]BCJ75985.1 hypothetical protein CS0771_55290 [Catellatospora sp. IY07-71]
MNRDRLINLLAAGGEAFRECRLALAGGASFAVRTKPLPADELAPTYAARLEITEAAGLDRQGMAAAVEVLKALGDGEVCLGEVVAPRQRFLLFLLADRVCCTDR